MPRLKQPRTLLALCVNAVAQKIISQSESLHVDSGSSIMLDKVEVARQEYISSLPGTVRTLLLEEVTRVCYGPHPFFDVTSPVMLSAVLCNYAAAMLLAPDVDAFCLRRCCFHFCNHVEALLELLVQEGVGLKSLDFSEGVPVLLQPLGLERVLVRPESLRNLYLRYICRDRYLEVISKTCPNLSLLDISGSEFITELGIELLVFRKEIPFMEGVTSPEDVPLCLDPSCGRSDCKRLRFLFKVFSGMQCSNGAGRLARALENWKHGPELCGTLRVLDICETGVSPRGALLALMKVPSLHSLGSYLQLGTALEMFDTCWRAVYQGSLVAPPGFGLHSAYIRNATERQLSLLGRYFPSLTHVRLLEPHIDPSAIALLPPALNILHVGKVPSDRLWSAEFLLSLRKFQGGNLQYLSFCFFSDDAGTVNLLDVFQSCPNLRSLRGRCMEVQWAERWTRSNVWMLHLRDVLLGTVVTSKVVVETLKRSPNLEIAHFYDCPDLMDADLTTCLLLKHLKCFYVGRAPGLTAQTVSAMQTACENLSHIGDLTQWDISSEDLVNIRRAISGTNLDMHLTDHLHCSSQSCSA